MQGNNLTRKCTNNDFGTICCIINDAAEAFRGIIPEDRWKETYMSRHEFKHEIDDGVVFWGCEKSRELFGVMGIQPVQNVTLIRHAYVCTVKRNQGIEGKLLTFLFDQINSPILIGTWASAVWAIHFYGKYGFMLVSPEEKNRLLKKYWSIPERQVENSVVLADREWITARNQAEHIE